jgi:hypothetical protein
MVVVILRLATNVGPLLLTVIQRCTRMAEKDANGTEVIAEEMPDGQTENAHSHNR